jgi:hypothetical protein
VPSDAASPAAAAAGVGQAGGPPVPPLKEPGTGLPLRTTMPPPLGGIRQEAAAAGR